MKKIASLCINIQLTKCVITQLAELDKLIPELESRGITLESARITTTPPAPKEASDIAGPNELAWLALSGRTRMNMRDKSLSREEQAMRYLLEKGLTPTESLVVDNNPDEELYEGDPLT